jgi:cobalt-zinc-cadmium efflux system outer membrane protein
LRTTMFARGVMLLVPGIMFVLTSVPALADQRRLSMSQAVEYSLQNNGEIRSLREEKGIREADRTRAGLLPNPAFDFEADTGALNGRSADSSLSFGVSQELLLLGKRDKRLAVAERELEIYGWQLADRERILREEVKTVFYETLLTAKRIDLADRAIELNSQLLDVTGERLKAGDIPELEMNLVKVELARSEGVRIDAARLLDQSQAKLRTLMGLPDGESPDWAGSLDAEDPMTKTPADLKRHAKENRPDLRVLEAERRRGDADVLLAQAERMPNPTAGLAVIRDTTAIDEAGGGEGKDTAYTVGLRFSMPIPLFDNNKAGVQEARARRNSAEIRLAAAGKAIEREVETAYAGFLSSGKILSLYKTTIIPQTEENLKLVREAYRLGEVGILAVIQEQKNYFEVNDGYLTALHDRQTALVKLESAAATELIGGVQ